MHPAVFLDRDGVIVENQPDYIRSWSDVVIFPQAIEALVNISSSAYKIVVVTNQSAVGRGLISLQQAEEINANLIKFIQKAGGRVDGLYMCPHAPSQACTCRKPLPGLFIQAAQQLHIDLSASLMIGDAYSDLQAGQAAGIRELVLLRTGRGFIQEKTDPPADLIPFAIYDTLYEALAARITS